MRRTESLKEKSKDYFNSVAASGEVISEPMRCYPHVLERIPTDRAITLIDVGCGSGEMLARIQEVCAESSRLFGIDLAEECVRQAREKCGERVCILQGDVEAVDCESGAFDMVLCMHSFHHYPHPMRALREMKRLLRPGGTLILVENDYRLKRWFALNVMLVLKHHPCGDLYMYTRRQLALLVRLAGFTIGHHAHIEDHSQLLVCGKR